MKSQFVFTAIVVLILNLSTVSAAVCDYALKGDCDTNCKVDFDDFSMLSKNWQVDCNSDPANSACFGTPYDVEWTKQLRTSSWDISYGVAVDSLGNTFISGWTYGDLDGGGNAGSTDVFLAKYDAAGTLLWTKQLGTSYGDYCYGVAVDSLGNAFISGYTGGDLDGGENAGLYDAFLAKYDTDGTLLWTKLLGTSYADFSYGVAVDSLGNAFISGYTWGDLDGGGNVDTGNAFLAKYDTAGTLLWTKQLATSSHDRSHGIAVDSLGNIFISGWTTGDLGGSGNAGEIDAFLAKYNTGGTLLWTKQLGTSSWDLSYDIAVDSLGNAFISGATEGDLDGGGNAGDYDAFLAKYDAGGTMLWIKQLGTSYTDYSYDVAVDSLGNAFISGWTEGDLDGNGNAGGYDAFMAKYDAAGTLLWTKQLGTSSDDFSSSVAVDSLGNVFISGSTYGDLDGGGNASDRDVFVIKFTSDPDLTLEGDLDGDFKVGFFRPLLDGKKLAH